MGKTFVNKVTYFENYQSYKTKFIAPISWMSQTFWWMAKIAQSLLKLLDSRNVTKNTEEVLCVDCVSTWGRTVFPHLPCCIASHSATFCDFGDISQPADGVQRWDFRESLNPSHGVPLPGWWRADNPRASMRGLQTYKQTSAVEPCWGAPSAYHLCDIWHWRELSESMKSKCQKESQLDGFAFFFYGNCWMAPTCFRS